MRAARRQKGEGPRRAPLDGEGGFIPPLDPAAAGFTLVELVAVMAIIVVLCGLAVLSYARSRRGAAAPAYARGVLAAMHQARQAAMVLKRPTRLRLTPNAPSEVISEIQDPTNPLNWNPLGGRSAAPPNVELCNLDFTATAGAITPTCPLAAARIIRYGTDGRVVATDGAGTVLCPTGGAPACLGMSVPIRTSDGGKQLKIFLYGLTAQPQLMTQW